MFCSILLFDTSAGGVGMSTCLLAGHIGKGWKMDAQRLVHVRGQQAPNLLVEQTGLPGMVLDDVDLSRLRASNVNFTGAALDNCKMEDARVTRSNLSGATIDGKSVEMALAATTGEPDRTKRVMAVARMLMAEPHVVVRDYDRLATGDIAHALYEDYGDAAYSYVSSQSDGVRGELAACARSTDQGLYGTTAWEVHQGEFLKGAYPGDNILCVLGATAIVAAMADIVKAELKRQ